MADDYAYGAYVEADRVTAVGGNNMDAWVSGIKYPEKYPALMPCSTCPE